VSSQESGREDAAAGTDAAALEAGRLLFARECRFLISAVRISDLPDTGLPEVAFAGRSNVGKSSLVNALTSHKALARTSNTPGRTRQLNFFDLGGRLVLVDLPGYGYAQAGKAEIRHWTGLTRDYLKGRALLRRICLLIDARHGIKDSDRQIMSLLDQAAVSYQVTLTKADKQRPAALAQVRQACSAELARRPAAHPALLATSSITGAGIEELRAALAALASPDGGQ